MPRWSSGQDVSLSRTNHGFDSRTWYKKYKYGDDNLHKMWTTYAVTQANKVRLQALHQLLNSPTCRWSTDNKPQDRQYHSSGGQGHSRQYHPIITTQRLRRMQWHET